MLKHVIEQTGGDLRKSNVIANMGEHLALSIYKLAGPNKMRARNYIRSAINDFKYQDPKTLPKKAGHKKLCGS